MAMEEERKTQRELILEHLKAYGTIEPMTALREYGCYRLGARIADLRAEGYDIATERVKEKSKRTGRTVQYALYRLGGAAKPKEGG